MNAVPKTSYFNMPLSVEKVSLAGGLSGTPRRLRLLDTLPIE